MCIRHEIRKLVIYSLKHVSSDIVHYTLSPFHEPRIKVKPGETVVVETLDALGGIVTEETPFEKLIKEGKLPEFFNPVSGPIYVEGAEPGDTLVVEITDIKVSGLGVTVNVPGFGGLRTPYLQKELPPITKISKIEDNIIHFPLKNGKIVKIPVKPLVGTIGVAPRIEAQLSIKPDRHGGNMDCPDITVGNKLYLPVFVSGALLYMGDVHAAQGEGEISGVAVEVSAEVTVKLDVLKGKSINWPRVESPTELITICSSASLNHAVRLAFTELVLWLEEDYGLDRMDAYMLCSQVAGCRLSQIVNPRYTITSRFPKEFLP